MLKRMFYIIGLGLVVLSCEKQEGSGPISPEPMPEVEAAKEVVFTLEEGDQQQDTKVTPVTSLSGQTVYYSVTTGTPGSSESVAHSGSSTFVSNPVSTGYYVASGPSRRFYVSNVTPSYSSYRVSITATNDTDIVVGYSNTASTSVSLTLGHIYARIGELSMTKQAGYDSIDGISWQIRRANSNGGTAGTYYPDSGSWSGCSGLASDTGIVSGSDLYVIPGSYIISCSYTLHKGAIAESITATATVDMVAGQVNNIYGTAVGGHAVEVTFSVTTAPWGTTHSVTEAS